jgi:hypothetical protein
MCYILRYRLALIRKLKNPNRPNNSKYKKLLICDNIIMYFINLLAKNYDVILTIAYIFIYDIFYSHFSTTL